MNIQFKKDYIIETTMDYSPMRQNTFTKTKVEELNDREQSIARRDKAKKLREEGNTDCSFGRQPTLTRKERFVKKTREYKKIFDKGSEFKTNPGINVLVGDNGCGKSTLIRLLIKENPDIKILHIDLESMNPKISTPGPEKGTTYSMSEVSNQFMWSVESHGETRGGVLMGILQSDLSDFDFIVLDEPEQGLSLKNQVKYFRELQAMGKEVIIITHSKVFIEKTEKVFDVETMLWVDSNEYLDKL